MPHETQVKKFDLKVASAGTVESFVQSSSAAGGSGFESKSVLGGQALLQKLEADLETLESHLVELNTYNERLTSEYNEKVLEPEGEEDGVGEQIGGLRASRAASRGGEYFPKATRQACRIYHAPRADTAC